MMLILMILVWSACMVPAEAQFGGTKTVADTQTVSQKFHVFRLKDGQRFETPEGTVDTLKATVELTLPLVNPKPLCDASAKGVLLTDTSDNRAYFCNGSAWKIIAYDADVDGLTDLIDANEAVPFTAGTAGAGEVLSGATVYSGAGMIYTTGTMPNQGAWNSNPASGNTAIPAGYHNGSGVLYGDGDFVAANIRAGSDLWGTVGTYPSSSNRLPGDDGTANASAGWVLSGYEAWDSDGTNIHGTMSNRGGWTSNPASSNVAIPAGYHSGGGYIAGDGDFSPANIRSSTNLWGTVGTYPSAANRLPGDDGTANASAGWVLSGYEVWDSDGTNIHGTMPNRGAWNVTPSASNQTVPSGYHSGGGVVYGDGNLSAGNIKSGVSIFGVTGNFNPVSTYNHWTHSGQWNGYYMRATDMANVRKFCRENGRDGLISYAQSGCCGATVWWYNDSNPQNNNYGKSSGADQGSWPHVTSITCGNTSNLY